jgi:hypothetical protein
MFWHKILIRFKRKIFLKKWQTEKPSLRDIVTVLSFNDSVSYRSITAIKAMGTQIILHYKRVSDFFKALEEASLVIKQKGVRPTYLSKPHPSECILDDYLTNENNVPIPPDIVAEKLLRLFKEFAEAMTASTPEEQSYYRRVYGYLFRDGAAITEALDRLANS